MSFQKNMLTEPETTGIYRLSCHRRKFHLMQQSPTNTSNWDKAFCHANIVSSAQLHVHYVSLASFEPGVYTGRLVVLITAFSMYFDKDVISWMMVWYPLFSIMYINSTFWAGGSLSSVQLSNEIVRNIYNITS